MISKIECIYSTQMALINIIPKNKNRTVCINKCVKY